MISETKQNSHRLVARPPLVSSSFRKLEPDRFDKIRLFASNDDKGFRYELTVVDQNHSRGNIRNDVRIPIAVFLIPAGRETEYLFSSRRGLLTVARSARTSRLVAVSFPRQWCDANNESITTRGVEELNYYRDEKHVQNELVETVQLIYSEQEETIPPQQLGNFQIPFMAVDGVGRRDVIARGSTPTTGDYIVEQVVVQERFVRRLYFLRNPNVIQSEVYMKDCGESGRGLIVDHMKLAFAYHEQIVAGFIVLGKKKLAKTSFSSLEREHSLLIGLGGGGLANFFQAFFHGNMNVTAVEIDIGVVNIAKNHFGFNECRSMNVIVGDGLTLCSSSEQIGQEENHGETNTSQVLQGVGNELADSSSPKANSGSDGSRVIKIPKSSLALIVVDVDSKDKTVGMSCPPVEFVNVEYLRRLKQLLKESDGILAINVSARDPAMLDLVKKNASEVFSSTSILVSENEDGDEEGQDFLAEELNVVVFAVNGPASSSEDSTPLLPPQVERIETLHRICDENEVSNGELRGRLEECAVSIKNMTTFARLSSGEKKQKKNAKRKTRGGKKKGKRR